MGYDNFDAPGTTTLTPQAFVEQFPISMRARRLNVTFCTCGHDKLRNALATHTSREVSYGTPVPVTISFACFESQRSYIRATHAVHIKRRSSLSANNISQIGNPYAHQPVKLEVGIPLSLSTLHALSNRISGPELNVLAYAARARTTLHSPPISQSFQLDT